MKCVSCRSVRWRIVSQTVTTSFSTPFMRMYHRGSSGSRSTATTAGARTEVVSDDRPPAAGLKPTEAAHRSIAASQPTRSSALAIGDSGTSLRSASALPATYEMLGRELLVGRAQQTGGLGPGETPCGDHGIRSDGGRM